MVQLGLFFPIMTDYWYPSRKPKCKSHLWLHCCSPSHPSAQVQMCSLWQPWVRMVADGCSVLARCCTSVLVTAPLFCLWGSTSASRYGGDRCWCPGLRTTFLPVLQMNLLSSMTPLAGAGQFWGFSGLLFFFSLLVMKFFNIVPGGFMLQILSAGFSFYWPFFWPPCTSCRKRGGKATLGIWGSAAAPVFLPFPTTSVFQSRF